MNWIMTAVQSASGGADQDADRGGRLAFAVAGVDHQQGLWCFRDNLRDAICNVFLLSRPSRSGALQTIFRVLRCVPWLSYSSKTTEYAKYTENAR